MFCWVAWRDLHSFLGYFEFRGLCLGGCRPVATSALCCAFGCPRAFSSDGGIRHPGNSFIWGTGGWRQATPLCSSSKTEVGETWPRAISRTQPGQPGFQAWDAMSSPHCQCGGYKTTPREAACKPFAHSFQKPMEKNKKVLNSLIQECKLLEFLFLKEKLLLAHCL